MNPFKLTMGGQGTVTPQPEPEWAKWVNDPAFIRAICDAVDAEFGRRSLCTNSTTRIPR